MMAVPGYRARASGLLVPDEISRAREVWTPDEKRLLDRATKLLESRGVELFMGCGETQCKGTPIERLSNADGGMTLRCAHKDRVFPRKL